MEDGQNQHGKQVVILTLGNLRNDVVVRPRIDEEHDGRDDAERPQESFVVIAGPDQQCETDQCEQDSENGRVNLHDGDMEHGLEVISKIAISTDNVYLCEAPCFRRHCHGTENEQKRNRREL